MHVIHIKDNLDISDSLFMHQNGLPQWVSQLALQARVRARAWRKGGGLGFPLCPSPQTEKWKQVSVWERSSDVTGYTASSSNPAGTFSPRILSLDKHGANCCGIKGSTAAVQAAFSQIRKKKKKKNQQIKEQLIDSYPFKCDAFDPTHF